MHLQEQLFELLCARVGLQSLSTTSFGLRRGLQEQNTQYSCRLVTVRDEARKRLQRVLAPGWQQARSRGRRS